MKYKFSELVDIQKIQALTDAFHDATNFASAIISAEGEVLSGSGWQDICENFHRNNPESEKVCIESDTEAQGSFMAKKGHVIYLCPHGLIDAGAPIIIDGQHMASYFTGQFLFRKPDEKDKESFRKQARRYGFDECAYMDALDKVPIIPEEKTKPILKYLRLFAEIVGHMGLEQRKQKDEISKRIELERRKEYLNSTLRSILNISQLIREEEDPEKLLKGTCEKLIGSRSYEAAWVALFDENRQFLIAKEAGLGEEFTPLLEQLARNDPPGCFREALRQSETVIVKDRHATCGGCPLSRRGTHATAFAARLHHSGKTYGALICELSKGCPMNNEELSLFSELANDIALAINNLHVQKERKRMQKALALRERELRDKSHSLENINQALKTMLDHRELEKKAVEENMAINLKRFVYPYLEELRKSIAGNVSRTYFDIVHTNLNELVTPISNTLSLKYIDLTPTEIRVADMIRQGKDTKEIASFLNLSPSTVFNFRNNIRRKLGLTNKRLNLRTYLESLTP